MAPHRDPRFGHDETLVADALGAESITLIVHGVGSASDKGLLTAAGRGYVASGLPGTLEPLTLMDCPVLGRRRTGASGLTLRTSRGAHLLIALPWADRRIRLSGIARSAAAALATFAIVAAGAFVLRGPLDALTEWLRPWPHHILAYFYLLIIGRLWSSRIRGSEGRFNPDLAWFILTLPVLLSLIGTVFLDATWLWIPIALLVVVLWLVPAVTVMRCCRIAPTLSWRLVLLALIVALAMPAAPLLRLANEFALEAAASRRAEAALLARSGERVQLDADGRVHDPTLDRSGPAYVTQSEPLRTEERSSPGVDEPHPSIKFEEVHVARPWVLPSTSEATVTTDHGNSGDPTGAVVDDVTTLNALEGKGLAVPNVLRFWQSMDGRRVPLLGALSESLDRIAFPIQLKLAMLMLTLCLSQMAISWFVDFGIDVLAYGSHPKHRASLVNGTIETVRWLHTCYPRARIIVVGHSLGSVIAVQAMAALSLSEQRARRLTLVTLGSPLNYLSRLFPASVKSTRELASALAGRVQWINLWRRNDLIGKALDIGATDAVQYCVGGGGHANYWSDGAVWRAVAQEVLASHADDDLLSRPRTEMESCVLERRLGSLVFLTIAVLAVSAFGIWIWA